MWVIPGCFGSHPGRHRVILVRVEGTGLSWLGRINPIRPGSNRVGRVRSRVRRGSTRVERVCNPGAALGHPEPVGLSHARTRVVSVSHLTRPTRVNPPDPGQPGINNPVRPIFSRLLVRLTRWSHCTRRSPEIILSSTRGRTHSRAPERKQKHDIKTHIVQPTASIELRRPARPKRAGTPHDRAQSHTQLHKARHPSSPLPTQRDPFTP